MICAILCAVPVKNADAAVKTQVVKTSNVKEGSHKIKLKVQSKDEETYKLCVDGKVIQKNVLNAFAGGGKVVYQFSGKNKISTVSYNLSTKKRTTIYSDAGELGSEYLIAYYNGSYYYREVGDCNVLSKYDPIKKKMKEINLEKKGTTVNIEDYAQYKNKLVLLANIDWKEKYRLYVYDLDTNKKITISKNAFSAKVIKGKIIYTEKRKGKSGKVVADVKRCDLNGKNKKTLATISDATLGANTITLDEKCAIYYAVKKNGWVMTKYTYSTKKEKKVKESVYIKRAHSDNFLCVNW